MVGEKYKWFVCWDPVEPVIAHDFWIQDPQVLLREFNLPFRVTGKNHGNMVTRCFSDLNDKNCFRQGSAYWLEATANLPIEAPMVHECQVFDKQPQIQGVYYSVT